MVLLRGVSSPFRENYAPAGDIYSFPSGARRWSRASAGASAGAGAGASPGPRSRPNFYVPTPDKPLFSFSQKSPE